MKNRIPYLLIITLFLCKLFSWWLFFIGSNVTEGEITLSKTFPLIHQFSYLVLTSFLVIGLLFKSHFAYWAFWGAFAINLIIYTLKGTLVYQSILDPIFIICLSLIIYYRQPNSWFNSKTTVE